MYNTSPKADTGRLL